MFPSSLTSHFHEKSHEWFQYPLNEAPATTFLHRVVEICESISHCEVIFLKDGDKSSGSRSSESLRVFVMSSFAMMMSHFEMFQKNQFAQLVDTQDFMVNSDDMALAKRLEKEGCAVTLHRILVGRGSPREPGQIIADSLGSWHNPSRVNQYFQIIFPKLNVYSKSAIAELDLMWQLRHSIVHTGGVVTREDAVKVSQLRKFTDRKLVLEGEFIMEAGRRLHMIVKHATSLLESVVREGFIRPEDGEDYEEIIQGIIGCKSPNHNWLGV